MKTRAAVLYETNRPFEIEVLDLEPPRAGEVLVKVAAAGICRSDWHLVTGATQHPLPVVPGHEGAGVVEAVGEGVTRVGPGDHVVLNWAPNCGSCFYCLNNRPSLCSTYVEPIWAGTMMDGTPRLSRKGQPIYHFCALACFAEYAVVPQESCVLLQENVPFPVGALIGCAVTTGVGAVLNTAQVQAGSSVAVFGVGGVGLSTVMGAHLAGAVPLIAIDTVAARADVAKALGATHFVTAGSDTIEAIRDLTEGRGADYVFDATGVPAVRAMPGSRPARRHRGAGRPGADGQQHQPARRRHHPPGKDRHRHLLRQRLSRARLPPLRRPLPPGQTRPRPAHHEDLYPRSDQRRLRRPRSRQAGARGDGV